MTSITEQLDKLSVEELLGLMPRVDEAYYMAVGRRIYETMLQHNGLFVCSSGSGILDPINENIIIAHVNVVTHIKYNNPHNDIETLRRCLDFLTKNENIQEKIWITELKH